jgi:hypothetical protein
MGVRGMNTPIWQRQRGSSEVARQAQPGCVSNKSVGDYAYESAVIQYRSVCGLIVLRKTCRGVCTDLKWRCCGTGYCWGCFAQRKATIK